MQAKMIAQGLGHAGLLFPVFCARWPGGAVVRSGLILASPMPERIRRRKMAGLSENRLVARLRSVLRDQPIPVAAGDGVTSGSARRVALALRLLALQAAPATPPKVIAAPPPEPLPEPLPEPPAAPPPAPPPEPPKPRKPPRVNLSTIRLEDAASLLASVSADEPPAPPPLPPKTAAAKPDAAVPAAPKFKLQAMADLSALQAADDLSGPAKDADVFGTDDSA